jgi:sterol desaturase/sphingolipid hydroxylase (fatty acid hydroxylase superfamily)
MRSTWRRNQSQWTIYHKLLDSGNLHHIDLDREVPKFSKDTKVSYLADWQLNRFVLFYTVIPFAIHEVYWRLVGNNFGPLIAFIFYQQATKVMMTRALHSFKDLGHSIGFLDGDNYDRDGVPDVGVRKTFLTITAGGILRAFATVYLCYSTNEPPSSLHWGFLIPEISLYGLILDFWFYWYHRLMHDVHGLWRFHRTHHLTKHPNMLLAGYADIEQDFFDILGIPLMTFWTMRCIGLPMGFYEWFACQQFITFSEVSGHSGVRMYASAPGPLTWLWRLFDAELVIEDHDLHHRFGYRKSHNYGKQTRVWDRVFGTCIPRIECAKDNVDFNKKIKLALY